VSEKTFEHQGAKEPAHWNRSVYQISQGKYLLNVLLPMDPSSTQNTVGKCRQNERWIY
jgi:hypothetical protein